MISKAPATGVGLIFVHASWCGPCQRTKPGIEEISAEDNGVEVVMIDGDEDLDKTGHRAQPEDPLTMAGKPEQRGEGDKGERTAHIVT